MNPFLGLTNLIVDFNMIYGEHNILSALKCFNNLTQTKCKLKNI